MPKKKGRETKVAIPEWKWVDLEQGAFVGPKEHLTSANVLANSADDIPFTLYTDASNKGLGTVLSQTQEGNERVIAYASRGLKKNQR